MCSNSHDQCLWVFKRLFFSPVNYRSSVETHSMFLVDYNQTPLCSVFTPCMLHTHIYVMRSSKMNLSKLNLRFQRYSHFSAAQNNEIQRKWSTNICCIYKSILVSSDSFCLITMITSHNAIATALCHFALFRINSHHVGHYEAHIYQFELKFVIIHEQGTPTV